MTDDTHTQDLALAEATLKGVLWAACSAALIVWT